MPRIVVPDDFAQGIVNEGGAAGREWLDRLPGLFESLCNRWKLVAEGEPLHGALGLVIPVKRGAELGVLKVSWLNDSSVDEIAALSWWNGNGAVRLLEVDADLGAMLLERLDMDRSLDSLEIQQAIVIAGQLLRRLAVPAPAGLPRLPDIARRLQITLPERWEQTERPMSRTLVDAACDTAEHLGPSAESLLVDYDLHYENVLAGQREPWLAIDPKVVVGDPEYGIAQLLWTRLEDIEQAGGLDYYFDRLVDAADLERARARSWTLVRIIDYWLWALGAGLTIDPRRCERIANWLISNDGSSL